MGIDLDKHTYPQHLSSTYPRYSLLIKHKITSYFINQPSGRAVTQPTYLPWSSGDDFRLSLKPISAGDRGIAAAENGLHIWPTRRNENLSKAKPSPNPHAAPYITTKQKSSTRPAGPMARRLTTNQEIAGSIPASVNFLEDLHPF
ncbi:hypothetical protein N7535_006107 [Penicillium sp. DV-2018c]|nr:hypothetical protein N7461_007811 [Penicillium sp. DV-2018c]KAJ5566801.1 hypothetical protein N7535_006107 [Penicillium sp. DV-2018c]